MNLQVSHVIPFYNCNTDLSKILIRFRDIGENMMRYVKLDFALFSISFCQFLNLSKFQYFFSNENPSMHLQNIMQITNNVLCWEFKAINDYRSKMGQNGRRSQLRHFLSNYIWSNQKLFIQFNVVKYIIDSFGKK